MGKRKKNKKIDVSGNSDSGGESAFGTLAFEGLEKNINQPLPEGPKATSVPETKSNQPNQKQSKPKTIGGRLDVKREKSGRGGKTVTVIYSFPGMDAQMKKTILSLLKKKLATGGTISNSGNVEIQGDFAEKVVEVLKKENYQAVRSGG